MNNRNTLACILLGLAILLFIPIAAANQSCSLSVASIPQGGMVAIDGKNFGNTPLTDILLTCGPHTVGVQKGGYVPYNSSITISLGEHQDVIANLQKVPDRGQVIIRSEPSGGDLYIDGKDYGATPVTADNLLPGRHEVLIQKTGYEDYRDVISVSKEMTAEYKEYLIPLPGTGFLSVTSYPEGAAVMIDGKAAGTTPTHLQRVTTGIHQVDVSMAGYWNFSRNLSVKGGESLLAKADLIPVPTTCTLYLDSSPSGAGIYLNGMFKGQAPETLDTLPAGNYLLEFRFPGNVSVNQSFMFLPGSTHEIAGVYESASGGSIVNREWLYQDQSRSMDQTGWIQANTTPVIERSFNWTASGHEARITLDIPQDIYEYYKEQPHPREVSAGALASYAIHEMDREYLHALVKTLKDVSGFKSYNARNDYRNVVAFVQSIAYEKDTVTGQVDDYWKYPVETLADGNGDCEDTAILAAALLKEMGYEVAVVFLPSDPGHAAVAVACENCNGFYYPLNGRNYYYMETAAEEGFSLGTMGKEYQNMKAQVVPI